MIFDIASPCVLLCQSSFLISLTQIGWGIVKFNKKYKQIIKPFTCSLTFRFEKSCPRRQRLMTYWKNTYFSLNSNLICFLGLAAIIFKCFIVVKIPLSSNLRLHWIRYKKWLIKVQCDEVSKRPNTRHAVSEMSTIEPLNELFVNSFLYRNENSICIYV